MVFGTAKMLMFIAGLSVAVGGGPVSQEDPAGDPAGNGGTSASEATTPAAPTTTSPTYSEKMSKLEDKVVNLQEKIFKTQTRLMLLKEKVMKDVIAESKGLFLVDNGLSGAFSIKHIVVFLDDKKIYYSTNAKGELDDDPVPIFQGNLVPGNHVLSVQAEVQGKGSVFTYMEGYQYKIKSSYTFYAKKGRILKIAVSPFEAGDLTTPVQDRPSMKFTIKQYQYNKENFQKIFGTPNE